MERLGLKLHPEKTRMVDLDGGKEGFVFLGCTVRKRRSIQRQSRWYFVQRWPSPRAMKRVRARVRELTESSRGGIRDVKVIIADLNRVLRGWGNYFRTGNADRKFSQVDDYVHLRLTRWVLRRAGQRRPVRFKRWPPNRFYRIGLHRLRGTVRYPAQATPRRPSVSRVPEMGMHGLKGGSWRRAGL